MRVNSANFFRSADAWLRFLEPQVNFIRKCPCQAKDRVRLLADKIILIIQKLEERLCVCPGADYSTLH
jgi:hypothetical protein